MVSREEIIEALQEVENCPLGALGHSLLEYLKENEPKKYHFMMMDGTLLPVVMEREKEATEYMIKMNDRLLEKNPVPENATYLERVQHLGYIDQQAREFTMELLYSPLPS